MILLILERGHLPSANVFILKTSGSVLGDQGRQRLEGLARIEIATLRLLFVMVEDLSLGNGKGITRVVIATDGGGEEAYESGAIIGGVDAGDLAPIIDGYEGSSHVKLTP